jgi:peroxin-19
VTKPASGVQGLGTGLPSLTSGKKKSTSKSSKDKHVAGQAAHSGRGLNPEANLSATLERLAEQTRHTVESIDAPSVGDGTAEDMEIFVKQFEALGGSQVLLQTSSCLCSWVLSLRK